MKVLVTGGAGFIGSHLCKRLLSEGHEVHSLDNYSTGNTSNHLSVEGFIAIYTKGDVSKWDDIKKLPNDFDVVFHLAGLLDVNNSLSDPNLYMQTNVVGVTNMLEFCRINNIKKFIYAGSCASTKPLSSPYALTKYIPEYFLELYNNLFDINTLSVRFYNVYGENMTTSGFKLVVSIFLEAFRNNLPLPIVGDGKQTRDYIYVGDIVNGLIKCLEYKGNRKIFNLGTGKSVSINEIVSMFGNVKTINIPERNEPKHIKPSDILISKSELGWEAKTSMKSWIKNSIKK
tara:strand:- start:524 stop:1384 length:861 start_codon:yes stop_codon:yes gene_type:complete